VRSRSGVLPQLLG